MEKINQIIEQISKLKDDLQRETERYALEKYNVKAGSFVKSFGQLYQVVKVFSGNLSDGGQPVLYATLYRNGKFDVTPTYIAEWEFIE